MVCRLTPRNYNRLFLNLLGYLGDHDNVSSDLVRELLLRGSGESVRWPDDEEFRKAWLDYPLYKNLLRDRVRLVLRALDGALHTANTESYNLKGRLTVEHIMPQSWQRHWPLPPLEEPQESEEYLRQIERRDTIIHTIGNLTLLTKRLNPSVSNGAFDEKKEKILQHSAINLNRPLSQIDVWDEEQIRRRGQELFEVACRIWPHPVRGGR